MCIPKKKTKNSFLMTLLNTLKFAKDFLLIYNFYGNKERPFIGYSSNVTLITIYYIIYLLNQDKIK